MFVPIRILSTVRQKPEESLSTTEHLRQILRARDPRFKRNGERKERPGSSARRPPVPAPGSQGRAIRGTASSMSRQSQTHKVVLEHKPAFAARHVKDFNGQISPYSAWAPKVATDSPSPYLSTSQRQQEIQSVEGNDSDAFERQWSASSHLSSTPTRRAEALRTRTADVDRDTATSPVESLIDILGPAIQSAVQDRLKEQLKSQDFAELLQSASPESEPFSKRVEKAATPNASVKTKSPGTSVSWTRPRRCPFSTEELEMIRKHIQVSCATVV